MGEALSQLHSFCSNNALEHSHDSITADDLLFEHITKAIHALGIPNPGEA
jgi:hypothetical protein